MTIDKEPDSLEVYSDGDRKLIISLLNEYAEKLLNICDQIDRHQRNLTVLVLVFAPATVLFYYFLILSIINTTTASLKIIIFASILTTLSVFVVSIVNGKQKLRFLERNAKIMSIRLEKVIRAASQAEEHIISNFANRLELDLRLSDAESALQQYTNLIKKRKLFGFF